MKIIKINLNITLAYLFAFSVIYQSGSVRAAVIGDGVLFQITRILMLVIPVISVIISGKIRRYFCILLIIAIISIVPLVINYSLYSEGTFQLLYKMVIVALSLMIFQCFSDKNIDIRENIYKLIIILAILSLIIYIPTEIFKLQIPHSIVYKGESYRYRAYFELFFTYHYAQMFPRLSGIFWEPGCYQIYLNLALFYYVFYDKNSRKQLMILLVSILFTQSTTGYCVAAFLLAIYIARSDSFTKSSKKIMAIVGVVLAVVAAVIVVSNKIATESGASGSYTLRTADLFNGLSIFLQDPICGVGFGNTSKFVALDAFGRESSNGLISYMYMTGLFGMAIALFPFCENLRETRNKFRQFIWISLFVIFNCVEPIYNLPIAAFWLGTEYAFVTKKIKVKR